MNPMHAGSIGRKEIDGVPCKSHGPCLTPVPAGGPEHRDRRLAPEDHAANDRLTPCCPRSRGPRLVLNLA